MMLWAEVIWRRIGKSGSLFCTQWLTFDRHEFAELLYRVGDCNLVVSTRTELSVVIWWAYLIILQFSSSTKSIIARLFSPAQLFSLLTQMLKLLVAANYTVSSGCKYKNVIYKTYNKLYTLYITFN